jgi:hypothetical protein
MKEEDKHPAAKAFAEWLYSDDGLHCAGHPIPELPFAQLSNIKLRLHQAFNAGWCASEGNTRIRSERVVILNEINHIEVVLADKRCGDEILEMLRTRLKELDQPK